MYRKEILCLFLGTCLIFLFNLLLIYIYIYNKYLKLYLFICFSLSVLWLFSGQAKPLSLIALDSADPKKKRGKKSWKK